MCARELQAQVAQASAERRAASRTSLTGLDSTRLDSTRRTERAASEYSDAQSDATRRATRRDSGRRTIESSAHNKSRRPAQVDRSQAEAVHCERELCRALANAELVTGERALHARRVRCAGRAQLSTARRASAPRHRARETAGAVDQRNTAFRVPVPAWALSARSQTTATQATRRDGSYRLSQNAHIAASGLLTINVARNGEAKRRADGAIDYWKHMSCVPARRVDSETNYLIWFIAACFMHRSAALELWDMYTRTVVCPWELNISRSDSEISG